MFNNKFVVSMEVLLLLFCLFVVGFIWFKPSLFTSIKMRTSKIIV